MNEKIAVVKDRIQSVKIAGGTRGSTGETGHAPVLEKGTTTTLNSGADATFDVETVSPGVYKLNAGIPMGPKGEGSATVSIKSTNTVDPGTPASVVNEGSSIAAELVFNIPKGSTGNTGMSAFDSAVIGGYKSSQSQFYTDLANLGDLSSVIDSINGEVV